MNIYDKARWQIEGGIPENMVVAHFKFMFVWLNEYKLLSEYGVEILNDGINEDAILTDEMVNVGGKNFLDKYYDQYISQIDYGNKENTNLLKELYYRV